MRIRHLPVITALLLLTSCYQFEITAQAGFSELALDGQLGYESGSTTAVIDQDIQSAFGLGDDQGTPFARVGLDMGTPTLAVSAFQFEDEGQGLLTANFGDNLAAGTTVLSTFDLTSAKISYTFEIPLGPLSVAPGLAVNFVDLAINVRDSIGVASEDIDLQAPLPMGFGRVELDLGDWVTLVGEGGYIQIDIDDIEAKMLDLEALAQINAFGPLNLFVGYRSIDLEGDGLIDSDSFDVDVGLSGWLIGGGIIF